MYFMKMRLKRILQYVGLLKYIQRFHITFYAYLHTPHLILYNRMLKPVIIKITANLFSQKLLEKFIRCSQEMLGIGVGAGVETSGEKAYVKLIKDSCTQP